MVSTAIPTTLLPYLSPLPVTGHAPDLWKVLSWQVPVLTLVGAVVWARRHCDAAIVIAPAYLAMTLLWPDINERRVILVLPIVTAWYVLGGLAVWHKIRAWARSYHAVPDDLRLTRAPAWKGGSTAVTASAAVAALVVAAAVAVPLALQFPRDYLFALGQNTSQPQGSRYARLLSQLGSPSQVVETSYLSTTALFTGHRTANAAFLGTLTSCQVPSIRTELASDHAAFLLLGDLNKFGLVDGPCLWSVARSSDWAVPLLHTSRDNASVFELIGPGTAHPNLRDLVAASRESVTSGPGPVSIDQWDWGRAEPVSQVSVGAAGAPGAATSVVVQLRDTNGVWRSAARAETSVGDGRGAAPYLLATLPPGTLATALRVIVAGAPEANDGAVADVHALGPIGSS
jgi:hypothetical protein